MLSSILPWLRCPACRRGRLSLEGEILACDGCGAGYPIRSGIADFLADPAGEVITPFQRLMQSRLVAAIYERAWRRAGYFLASWRPFERERSTVLAWALAAPEGPVLDLACGPGVFTFPLARQTGAPVLGLDLSLPMLRRAAARAPRNSTPNLALIRGSAFHMPFVDGTFSLIACCGALHLFDSPERALREIRRVLRPEGLLVVQTTLRPARGAGLANLLQRFIRFGFFDEEPLGCLLADSGLRIARAERHRISYTFMARAVLPNSGR